MPAENVFLSSGDAFVDDALRPGNLSGPNQAPNARVSSLSPIAGYVDGIGRLRMMAWGYQKTGSNTSPPGVTNRYAIQGPLQFLQKELTLNMGGNFFQDGMYESVYDGLTLMRDGTVGATLPARAPYMIPSAITISRGQLIPPGPQYWVLNGANGTLNMGGYGKPGASGWRIRLRWRSLQPSTGIIAEVWLGRRNYAGIATYPDQWYADTNGDGVGEMVNDRAIREQVFDPNSFTTPPPVAWQVASPTVGEWVEKVFTTDALYPYALVEQMLRVVIYPERFDVPQMPIEEEATEVFDETRGRWNEITTRNAQWSPHHQPVFDFEVVFHRRAPMLVFPLVSYGNVGLFPVLPAYTNYGTLTYNPACVAALAAAVAAYGNRVFVQLVGMPGVQWYVDVTDGAVTSNIKVAWLWNFGDGQTSPVQNTRHYYDRVGQYDVRLEVTDNAGDVFNSGENFRVLLIVPFLNMTFYARDGGGGGFQFVGQPVSFNPSFTRHTSFTLGVGWAELPNDGKAGGIGESYLWEFGDGATSTAKFPEHTYATAGNRSVRCTVTAPNGWACTHVLPISVLP